jgi:hypothetical protein
MNWYSGETQIRWACRELIKGREISHAHEIAEANGWRLAAIVWVLRHRYNWPIETRYGENRIAYYRLVQNVDIDSLERPRSFHPKKKGGATPSSSDK